MTLAALLLPFHLTRSQQFIVGPEFERMDRHERHDRNAAPGCKVFVGDLHPNAKERDVEEIFAKFGQLKNCFVAKNPGISDMTDVGGRGCMGLICPCPHIRVACFLLPSPFPAL